MPQSGKVIKALPSHWAGRYVELKYTTTSLDLTWLQVEETKQYIWQINEVDIRCLDSLSLAEKSTSLIDTAYFQDDFIWVKTATDSFTIPLQDTLDKEAFFPYLELNLKQGILKQDLEDAKLVDWSKCEVRYLKGIYYLNIEATEGQWETIKIGDQKQDLAIIHLCWADENMPMMEKIIGKENLQQLPNKNKSYQLKDKISDETFFKLYEKPSVLFRRHWYKTDKGISTEDLILGFVFILIIGVLVYALKK